MPKKGGRQTCGARLPRHATGSAVMIELQMPHHTQCPLTDGCFAYRSFYSTRSGIYFRNDNYIRVQGGSPGALTAVSQPLTALTHTFHRAPRCLAPSMDSHADRNAPSSLGRVASANIFAYMLTGLNVEERAGFHMRWKCSSISKSCADLTTCTCRE